ncbi:MAG: glycosyltransferase family 2 protein [Pseudomonadota bacterium]
MKKNHPVAPTLASYAAVAAHRPVSSAPAPCVSIVTVVRNGAATVGRTIESVQAQGGPTIEHVVVDGGSTDGTLALIERRLRAQDFWLSEADRGIADAFNKGVALTRGTYVQFLNADDWLSEGQLARAVATLESSGADFVFGDLLFYRDGRPAFAYRGDPQYANRLGTHLPPVNHPTLLARRSLFERVGLFCVEHRYSMEYDWLQRVQRAGGRGVHDPEIIGHMTHEGVSNLAFRRTVREVRDIAIAYGAPAWRTRLRAELNIAKTAVSQSVRARSPRLYDAVRRRINRAYVPLATPEGTAR